LAAHCGTAWVPEYGRELWENQCGQLSEQDLLKIAHEQIRREEDGLRLAQRYLFCDTSPLTTLGYSHWMFGKVHPELSLLARRPYDAMVVCSSDFPFVQDGTRRDETFRWQQQTWYQEQAAVMECPTLEAAGSVPERVSQVMDLVILFRFTLIFLSEDIPPTTAWPFPTTTATLLATRSPRSPNAIVRANRPRPPHLSDYVWRSAVIAASESI